MRYKIKMARSSMEGNSSKNSLHEKVGSQSEEILKLKCINTLFCVEVWFYMAHNMKYEEDGQWVNRDFQEIMLGEGYRILKE